MSLIGITGKAGVGKDTFGAALVRLGFKRISFADPLKEATAVIAGEPSHLYHTMEGKQGFSPVLNTTRRAALQGIGKAVRDVLDEGVWVRRALDTWDQQGRPLTCITDVRYDNEAQLVRSMGGTIVHIWRPGNEALTGSEAQHESERGIDPALIDIEICNDGTIGELGVEAYKIAALFPRPGQYSMGGYIGRLEG